MPRLYALAIIGAASILTACSVMHNKKRPTMAPLGATTAAEASNQQWQCQPAAARAWKCYEPSEAPPVNRDLLPDQDAKIKPGTEVSTDIPAAAQRETAPVPVHAAETEVDAGGASSTLPAPPAHPPDGRSSLLAYPEWVYSLQLIAARHPSTIDRLLPLYQETGHEVFRLDDPESGLELLLIGVFPDELSARRAREELDPPPAQEPWIRRLGPLQDVLRHSAD